MKLPSLLLGAVLIAQAFGACPFEQPKRSGLLTEEDLEKFESVRRDPRAAEALVQARNREASPQPAAGGIIGPILNAKLDLPYGGGLCGCPIVVGIIPTNLT